MAVRRFARSSIVLCTALAACSGVERAPADTAHTAGTPQRIVSLNPTTTELLFALGAGHRLVGRSRWDVFPDSAIQVPDVGDGLRPNVEQVLSVNPDLVILYESIENVTAVDRLRAAGVQTLVLRVDLLQDLRRAFDTLGILLGDTARARLVRDTVFASLDRVRTATRGLDRPTVFWHVWHSPIITIGSRSYLTELVDIAGGRNIYADLNVPSAPVALEDVVRRDPDFVLAGPTTADRIRSAAQWRSVRAVRDGRIAVFDTMLVGRPSVRVGEAARSLARLFHPGRIP
ncbi:MAG TPA: helical backbone metal receptor [Gemmatimonadaceae bacterium]|nr:helical backbone metal receptor [Gemmatimonadaceae bacterium]